MDWFLENRPDLAGMHHLPGRAAAATATGCWPSRRASGCCACCATCSTRASSSRPTASARCRETTQRQPYTFSRRRARSYRVGLRARRVPTGLFGGNSNWRGPIWFPVNYLLIEALERYHHFYGDDLKVECPTGSGNLMTLAQVAGELSRRLTTLFLPDAAGRRPCHGDDATFADDPHWKDLVLFHEYFHGDTGRGVRRGHQTGWTALVARCLEDLARGRG